MECIKITSGNWDTLINAGTLIVETAMWLQAIRSLKKTEESIKDTNIQNQVSNQRDLWKEALIAYRKLLNAAHNCEQSIQSYKDKNKDTSIPELSFFTFVSSWSKEYLLDTHLVDRKLIRQCAGKQLKVIYKYYSRLKYIPGYHNDVLSLRNALKKCDII